MRFVLKLFWEGYMCVRTAFRRDTQTEWLTIVLDVVGGGGRWKGVKNKVKQGVRLYSSD